MDFNLNTQILLGCVTQILWVQDYSSYTIFLDDCLEDIAANFIYEESEYSQVPPFVLVPLMFEAVNELIDQFSSSPEKYVSHALRQKIERAVNEYLAAA